MIYMVICGEKLIFTIAILKKKIYLFSGYDFIRKQHHIAKCNYFNHCTQD